MPKITDTIVLDNEVYYIKVNGVTIYIDTTIHNETIITITTDDKDGYPIELFNYEQTDKID
jgi:hypothetical protein